MIKQEGTSLIEFLLASSLGVIALGAVGSLYISGQKLTLERTQELLLLQNTASVLQMMKNDIQRAGFDGGGGRSIKISGAENTVFTLSGPDFGLVAYAYLMSASGASSIYKNVVYEQREDSPNALFICEKKQPSVMSTLEVTNMTATRSCNRLFDNKVIGVSKFELSEETVVSEHAKSAVVEVALGTYLIGALSINTEQFFIVKQRNWQE